MSCLVVCEGHRHTLVRVKSNAFWHMELLAVQVNLLHLHHCPRDRKLPEDMCHLLAVPCGFVDPVFPTLWNRTKQFNREPDTCLCSGIFFSRCMSAFGSATAEQTFACWSNPD